MAAKAKKEKKPTTKATPVEDPADNASDQPASMPSKAQIIGLMAKAVLKKASVTSLRPILPVIDAYARSRPVVDGKVADITRGKPDEFSDKEVAVLKTAGEKFAYEFIALASQDQPEGQRYIAKIDDETKQYPAPTLSHLLSAFVYGKRLLGLEDDKEGEPTPTPDGEGEEEAGTEIVSNRVVLLNAVGPGEYVPKVGAIKPNEIRRIAMSRRQVSLSQSSLSQSKQSVKSVKSSYASSYATGAGREAPREMSLQKRDARPAAAAGKCGCHGGGAASESVTRYDADGSCANPFKISCDTTWRLRDCLKTFLCDFLFCVSSQICEDGNFKKLDGQILLDCLGQAACSLIECVPNAICPPKQVCKPKPRMCQPCNFAVEEEI